MATAWRAAGGVLLDCRREMARIRTRGGVGLGWIAVAATLLAAWPAAGRAAPETAACRYAVGVLAHRPKPQVLAGWLPLGRTLERAVPGCRFDVEALDYPELEVAIAEARVDFVITNPAHYVAIRSRQPMSGVLATVIERSDGPPLAAFGGVIVVRADRRDLRGLADLAGATVAAVGTSSLGGYQAQAYELFLAGLELPGADRLRLTGMPHDAVVQQVVTGQADAGFLRSGVLERMAAEGHLDPGEVRVLGRRDAPGFPYALSTRLYPDWPVVALAHVDEARSRVVAAALLSLEHDGPETRAAAFHGFAIPADYAPVEKLLRDLRLPPFEAAPAFRVGDVLARYRTPLLVLATAGAVAAAMALLLLAANRRLARARQAADEAAHTLAQVLATVSVGIAKVRERRIVWGNRRMGELFGYAPSELEGAPSRGFYLDVEAYERVGREALGALAEGRTYVTEQRLRRKDGTAFWARMRGSTGLREGAAAESIWTFEDITERRQVEADLREALAVNEATLVELRDALASVKTLSGLLPICMYCHKIRTDQGYWDKLEVFISAHSDALFSHGICPSCLSQKHPEDE